MSRWQLVATGQGETATAVPVADGAGGYAWLPGVTAGYVDGRTPAVSIKDPAFGAVGDGVTDDAPAINAAIASLLVGGFSKGGTVYFPRTTAYYRVLSPILWYSGIAYVGETPHDSNNGTGGSRLVADAAGNYTTGPTTTGGATGYVMKYAGAPSFSHRFAFVGLGVDCGSVSGLGGIWCKGPGENSLIERVRVTNAGMTARTVSDAVTNGTTTVTSATAAFTADDVNAVIPSSADFPANTKIDQVVNATTVTLNNAALTSGTGKSMTINRPADAVMFTVGAATGLIRSLNVAGNLGAGLRLDGQGAGSWLIESLSGDNNGGGNLRVSAAATAADPVSITVVNIKAENSTSSSGANPSVMTMDPVILCDNSDMVALNFIGGSFITGYNQRDIIRVDQPVTGRGGPSIELVGVEAANPSNTQYTNIIHDSATGNVVAASAASGAVMYPHILWGRQMLLASGAVAQAIASTSAVFLANKLAAGDANYDFQITGDGKLRWGAGGASALDGNCNLYRSSANLLKTDGRFDVGSSAGISMNAAAPVIANAGGANQATLGWDSTGGAAGPAIAFTTGNDSSIARVVANQLKINNQLQLKVAAPVFSASITPNCSNGPWQTVTVTSATAFTINAPTNPPDSTHTSVLTIEVLNSSGGAMGVITWNAAFVFAGLTWTNPASTKKRFARFEWNGANWICISISPADY